MIVQHVSRDRHPRDLHHVLRYGDLEAAIPHEGKNKVFLSMHFTGTVASDPPEHRQSKRTGRKRAGLLEGAEYVQLVRVHYHPRAERVTEVEGKPWADVDDPVVIFGEVFPITRKVSEWFPRLRASLAELLTTRIATLTAQGLPGDRWLLHVGFLPESGSLEVGVTTWSDLRKNDEKIERVAI